MNEEVFLTRLFGRQEPVPVFLMNGFQIHGVIADTDDEMVLVESEGKQMAIYKHAISTIAPEKEAI